MKKLFFFMLFITVLFSCQVRHDHSKQMQQVRVPVDSAQKDDVQKSDDSWQDEGLIEIPQEERVGPPPADIDDKIERMMKGEDVDLWPVSKLLAHQFFKELVKVFV